MNDLVKSKLESMANHDQTFLEFIRESEDEFHIEYKNFEKTTPEQLNNYIGELAYLWGEIRSL